MRVLVGGGRRTSNRQHVRRRPAINRAGEQGIRLEGGEGNWGGGCRGLQRALEREVDFWVGFKKFPLKVKPTCVQIGDRKLILVSTGDRSMNLVSKSETTIIFGLC